MNKPIAILVLSVGSVRSLVAAEPVDFAHDVLPLLKARCATCHTNGTYEADFSMDTRESLLDSGVVLPGKSRLSALILRVTTTSRADRMPPIGDPLSDDEVATLRAWIDEGLKWEPGFTFKQEEYVAPIRPRRVTPPPPVDGRDNPVDRIVDAYWRSHQIVPPPAIDDGAFMRRVCLDLVGLLPTPAELESFLADQHPDKRTRLVRRLLANRRAYADHWLTFWNDLLRNDYQGPGYIDGGRKQITAWLYRSLVEDVSYDTFVRELISPSAESEGFIRGIKWRGNVNASQSTELQFSQNVSQVFLGINMKCASCHDSFIDDWKLTDAYGLAAVTAEKPLEIYRCDKPTGKTAQAAFLFPELGQIDAARPRSERLGQMAELMVQEDNGRLNRTVVNRLWHRLMGRGIVHPVDVMSNRPWSEDLLDFLAVDLADHGYDLKHTLELIATSQAYQSAVAATNEAAGPESFQFRGPLAKRMTAEQFVDAVWMITGTAPAKAAAKVTLPDPSDSEDAANVFIRASLVPADPLLRSLGRPNREQVVSTRPEQLTTLQALELSNGEVLASLLARGAANLKEEHADWSGEEITGWLYQSALCRRPNAAEIAVAQSILGDPVSEGGLADLLWVVFMLPEFQLVQ